MKTRTATCMCRKLQVVATGEPVRISVCHCLECQIRTGSAFGFQARFPDDHVRIEGEYKTHTRVEDGENRHFHFCPSCGSTVFYRIAEIPGYTAIPVGAFADPSFPPPSVSVFTSRKHAWVTVPGDAERAD